MELEPNEAQVEAHAQAHGGYRPSPREITVSGGVDLRGFEFTVDASVCAADDECLRHDAMPKPVFCKRLELDIKFNNLSCDGFATVPMECTACMRSNDRMIPVKRVSA